MRPAAAILLLAAGVLLAPAANAQVQSPPALSEQPPNISDQKLDAAAAAIEGGQSQAGTAPGTRDLAVRFDSKMNGTGTIRQFVSKATRPKLPGGLLVISGLSCLSRPTEG
jgi:hypothetical protein